MHGVTGWKSPSSFNCALQLSGFNRFKSLHTITATETMKIMWPHKITVETRKSLHSQKHHQDLRRRWLTAKKLHAWKNLWSAASATWTWRMENPASNVNIAFCLKTNTDVFSARCDNDLWPINPKINGFPGLMVSHVYVKFDDPKCIGLWDIVWKNQIYKLTDRCTEGCMNAAYQDTHVTNVNVGNKKSKNTHIVIIWERQTTFHLPKVNL